MNELFELIEKFEQHKNTHPNISNIWISFITYKLNKLSNLISQANIALNNFDSVHDLTPEQIYLLTNI